jgi:hypothetical protein
MHRATAISKTEEETAMLSNVFRIVFHQLARGPYCMPR